MGSVTALWRRSFGLLCIVPLLISSSCIYPISQQLREEAQRQNVTLPMVLENPSAYTGRIVLWGGKIIETANVNNGTEITVLQMPLNYMYEPKDEKSTLGRFIARSTKFLDPAVYKADREITLAGEVIGAEERPFDKTMYRYPVVNVREVHLWEQYYPRYYPDYYWYDPFWGPYPYYYGPFYYHDHDYYGNFHGHGGFHHR